MKLTEAQTTALTDYLQGTCHTLEEGLRAVVPDVSEDDLDESDLANIDNAVERCEGCSWWCEPCELSEQVEGYCSDCQDLS
jgi:hypothetical protein